MKENKWKVYLLECNDGSYYTGITNDLEKRMTAHKLGIGSKYVLSRGFGRLISFKEFSNKSEALKAEYAVKQLPRDEKLRFFS